MQKGSFEIIPYITAGDPSLEITKKIIEEISSLPISTIELGVPFSDPLADGIVIQRSHQVALLNKVTTEDVLTLVKEIKDKTKLKIYLLIYYNLIYQYKIENFLKDCRESGVWGLIIPDLPPEEAFDIKTKADFWDIKLTFLVAPTSTEERIRLIDKYTTGFLYFVSVTGITGVREKLPEELESQVRFVKALTNKPVFVGFGVSKKEHINYLKKFCDGAIIGSALIKLIHQTKQKEKIPEVVKAFLQSIF